ncbi:MAG: DUF2332 family protein [Deltaproteobacteria bacterium]|nr:DUF2332 family protein [Deltaproteobacteria bacterium]
MAEGLDGLAAELASHFEGAGAPGSYERVGRALAALAADEALTGPVGRAWAGRSFEASYARPLLLIASLRYRALGDHDHPLAPELLMDADAPDVVARTRAALGDPGLEPVLAARAVQTNEPGRAYGWGLPALVLGLAHRRFALVDIGCSAGLNLVVDRTAIAFRIGTRAVSGYDFPSPEARVGLDRAPIDVTVDDEARWLRACIWPGQAERLQRFEACRKVWASPWAGDAPRPELVPHDLADDHTLATLEAIADRSGSESTLTFESVVRPYLADAVRASHDEAMWRWLAGGRGRARAILEPSLEPGRRGSTSPMDLVVQLVRGGERVSVVLAQAGYHQAACLVVPGAPERLRAAWDAA